MKKYYPGIQALRGVLFLLILAFHCGVPYADFGWMGVEAFLLSARFFSFGSIGKLMCQT